MVHWHIIICGHSGINPYGKNNYLDTIELCSVIDEDAQNVDEETTMSDERFEVDIMLNVDLNNDWNKLIDGTLKLAYGTCKLSHLTTALQIVNLCGARLDK